MANQITMGRLLLVPVFVTAMVYYQSTPSYYYCFPLAVFLLACGTDALDGWVARVRGEVSLLGQMLDPIADKLLLASAFLCIYFAPEFPIRPPAWVVILVVSRDLFILCGILVIYLTTHDLHIKPTSLGKVTTAGQMVTIAVLFIPHISISIARFCWFMTALLTFSSGFNYLLREVRAVKTLAPLKGQRLVLRGTKQS